MPDLNDLSLPDLFAALADNGLVQRLFELARAEDLGPADVTTEIMIPEPQDATARVVAREPGTVAGLAAIPLLLQVFKTDAELVLGVSDGDVVEAGATLATLKADHARLLALERTLLNTLSRLSGVATHTRRFVDAVADTSARILDTRKTTPGLRALEKYAVRCAGAHTHRLGLYDAILIKDNHLAGVPLEDFTKRLGEACSRAWAKRIDPGLSFVEVEVDSLEQLDRALAVEQGMIDFILLDNFTLEHLRAAVTRRDRVSADVKLEASGNVTLDTVRAIADTGVDRISAGAITHHAVWLDIGLDIAHDADAAE
jgi:nicotinate-nucleotide pyrophosphorylase (carboxylating)